VPALVRCAPPLLLLSGSAVHYDETLGVMLLLWLPILLLLLFLSLLL
jgi:hypothetical protein